MAAEWSPRPRVVLVDDDDAALKSARAALERDFQVVTTGSATTLPRLLAYSGRPTLVLVDMDMPALSGADLVSRLQGERAVDTWFYVYSAQPEDRLRVMAAECGADGFVPKFGQAEDFRALVHMLFTRHLCRILLVAGSEAARLVPARSAIGESFEMVSVRSIQEALVQLRRRAAHVVIGCGALMDGTADGLYRAIRKTQYTRRVSILHLATTANQEQPGANVVLNAPFQLEAFRNAVQQLANIAPRRDVRVPLQAALTDASGAARGATRNISVSGLLAAFHRAVVPGTDMAITVPLPGLVRGLAVKAHVVRPHPTPSDAYAYGLRFLEISETDFDAVAGYVARHLGP